MDQHADQSGSKKSREALIEEITHTLNKLRGSMHPELLQATEKLIYKQQVSTEVKIDKARNVAFVKAFLESEAGAKFRDKIL